MAVDLQYGQFGWTCQNLKINKYVRENIKTTLQRRWGRGGPVFVIIEMHVAGIGASEDSEHLCFTVESEVRKFGSSETRDTMAGNGLL